MRPVQLLGALMVLLLPCSGVTQVSEPGGRMGEVRNCPLVVVGQVGTDTAWLVDKEEFQRDQRASFQVPQVQNFLYGKLVRVKVLKNLKGTPSEDGELWLLLSDGSLSFHSYESPAKVGKLQVLFLEEVELRPSSPELERLTKSAPTREYQVFGETTVDVQLQNVKQVCGGAEGVIPVSSPEEDRVKKIEKSLKSRKRPG